MRINLAAAALLLFFALQHAGAIEKPQLASYSSTIIYENGTVSVIGGEMQSLDINISIPRSTPYQQVDSSRLVRNDSEGNPYIKIVEAAPSNPFFYSRRSIVQAYARATPYLPADYVVPQEYSHFLSPTPRTQSNNAGIAALASQLTANSRDQFEKVARIAIWVNKNMEYDEQLVGQEHDAAWALQNKRGVCVEYSTLFAALARAAGIPTRYVTGYAYSDRFGSWMGHAWNEVYLGEWAPVDSTWFEVGTTDALHIEGAKYAELSNAPALVANVYPPGAQIDWGTSGRSGAYATNIVTQQVSFEEPQAGMQLMVASSELLPGERTIAYLAIEGKDYRVIQVSLAPCTGTQSVEVKGGTDYMVIRPNQTSVAVWELRAKDSLDKSYIYTCPLTLNSPYLEHAIVNVTVNPQKKALYDFQASLQKGEVSAGEENTAVIRLPDNRVEKKFYAITADGTSEGKFTTTAGVLPFTTRALGKVEVYIAGEGGGYEKLEFLSERKTGLSIDSFTVPAVATLGKQAKASARVSAASYPAQIKADFAFGGQNVSTDAEISAPSILEFQFVPNEKGEQQALLRIRGQGGNASDEKSAAVLVQTESEQAPAQQVPIIPQPAGQKPQAAQKEPAPVSPQNGACALPLAILAIALAASFTRRS